MNRIVIPLLLIVAASGAFTIMAQAPAEKHRSFLSALKEGQSVSLKEVAGRYELSTVEGVAAVQGYKVIEVASEYVVIQDVAGVTESRIPIFSIKAIVRLKVPGK